jgi:hypothetical protein
MDLKPQLNHRDTENTEGAQRVVFFIISVNSVSLW